VSTYNACVEGVVIDKPVIKTIVSGRTVGRFTIAIHHITRKAEGPRITFLDAEAHGDDVCKAISDIKKGEGVMISGNLIQYDNGNEKKIKIVFTVPEDVHRKEAPEILQMNNAGEIQLNIW